MIDITNELLKNHFKNDPKYLREIEDLYLSSKKANQLRNDIMHSHWLANSAIEFTFKFNERKNNIKENFKPEDINAVADFILETDNRLLAFGCNFEPAYR